MENMKPQNIESQETEDQNAKQIKRYKRIFGEYAKDFSEEHPNKFKNLTKPRVKTFLNNFINAAAKGEIIGKDPKETAAKMKDFIFSRLLEEPVAGARLDTDSPFIKDAPGQSLGSAPSENMGERKPSTMGTAAFNREKGFRE